MPEHSEGKINIKIEDSDIAEIIPLFLRNVRADVAALKSSILNGDIESVRKRGHALKGSGGSYGLWRISELGAEIEKAAKDNNAAIAQKYVLELESFLDRLNVIYG